MEGKINCPLQVIGWLHRHGGCCCSSVGRMLQKKRERRAESCRSLLIPDAPPAPFHLSVESHGRSDWEGNATNLF